MAKGEILLTNVKHGLSDGESVWVDEGTPVSDSNLPNDVIEQLRVDGAIGYPKTVAAAGDTIQAQAEELEKRADRIAELEAALEQAKEGNKDATPPVAPGTENK